MSPIIHNTGRAIKWHHFLWQRVTIMETFTLSDLALLEKAIAVYTAFFSIKF